MKKPVVITIAGSDSSGGAGIQADLKTMSAMGVYGMSAITALTAQNTTGVYGILDCTPEMLEKQLDCCFQDIPPQAAKIGMVSQKELIAVIGDSLKKYEAKNVVVDPVMVSTSGSKLLSDDAVDSLLQVLFPLATIITPNIPEAEVLTGMSIQTKQDMEQASKQICEQYHVKAVLMKGGHSINDANDLLYGDGICEWIAGDRIENTNTHGTGCTLSSAIACGLAKGLSLLESVKEAKAYISSALAADLDLGAGSGPLWHGWMQDK